MPSLVPFHKCVARSDELLPMHLISVKKSIEDYLEDGFDKATVKLAGLSGICHDLAKAHVDWQKYINNRNIKNGPNHSPCGAFLFSFLGYHLLLYLGAWEEKKREWLWLIHDISKHHSKLGNLTDESWLRKYDWEKIDLQGMGEFIKKQYIELEKIQLTENELIRWTTYECRILLEEVYNEMNLDFVDWEPLPVMKEIQKWRNITTALISGDRFNVKKVETNCLHELQCNEFIRRIEDYGRIKKNHTFNEIRLQAQTEIYTQLIHNSEHVFYTLEMPTGYGKTITSIKMASWFGENQGFKRIIYVAPYLSILEQTAGVIEKLLKVRVLEHHSLAIVDDDTYQRVSFSQLAMESWAHSIVCTSFHQFCKAVFPFRAQDVLRRTFLKDAVIIIDEPQILDCEIWNLFLCGLEAMAQMFNLKVIFLSATMPPFQYGLTKLPYTLSVKGKKKALRYKIQVTKDEYNETNIWELMQKNKRNTQAIILNTIKDAYLVFTNMKKKVKNIYLVHGFMTPIHKKMLINNIKKQLEKEHKEPIYVVSTSVLEAGVDISFQYIARALSILPSIVQVAGRVNRHMEDDIGIITVFPFYREGTIDTRSFIYPKALQNITDNLIFEKKEFYESEVVELVKEYYKKMFHHNTYEAALSRIADAFEGQWNRLSEISPFNKQYTTVPIFVPFEPNYGEFPEKIQKLKDQYDMRTPYDIYDKYSKKDELQKLSFEDRKKFMILFNYYVLNVPEKTAQEIVGKEEYFDKRIPLLKDLKAYDSELGLKAAFEEDLREC